MITVMGLRKCCHLSKGNDKNFILVFINSRYSKFREVNCAVCFLSHTHTHTHPKSDTGKLLWSFTTTPPYIFILFCLGRGMDLITTILKFSDASWKFSVTFYLVLISVGVWAEPHSSSSTTGRIISIKKSNDLIGNQSRDLPVCSIVSQPATVPRALRIRCKLQLKYI
jgi:hypothetical protein